MVFNHYEEERERRNDKKERKKVKREGVVESVHWMTLHFRIETCSKSFESIPSSESESDPNFVHDLLTKKY